MITHILKRVVIRIVLLVSLCACSRAADIISDDAYNVNSFRYSQISWSPDSSEVLAIGRRSHPASNAHLYLIEVADGRSEKMTEAPAMFDFPSWSPTGTKAAITIDLCSVWIIDIKERAFSRLGEGEGAVWLPDGNHVALYSGTTSNPEADHREVRILDLDGEINRTIDLGPVSKQMLENVPGASEHLTGISISPSGKYLILNLDVFGDVYSGGDKVYESLLVDLEESTAEPILANVPAISVSWSFNETRIAYIREHLHLDGDLVIMNLENKNETIAPLPPVISSPSWSNDASKIAFLYKGLIYIWEIDANLDGGS